VIEKLTAPRRVGDQLHLDLDSCAFIKHMSLITHVSTQQERISLNDQKHETRHQNLKKNIRKQLLLTEIDESSAVAEMAPCNGAQSNSEKIACIIFVG